MPILRNAARRVTSLGAPHHQFATRIVLGLEADWGSLHQEGRQDTFATANNAWNGMTQASILRETQWMSTARVRLGYASGAFMIHVTGGLAMAALSERRTQFEGLTGPARTVARFGGTDGATPLGWTLGVGPVAKAARSRAGGVLRASDVAVAGAATEPRVRFPDASIH